jgi:hypothetical protein
MLPAQKADSGAAPPQLGGGPPQAIPVVEVGSKVPHKNRRGNRPEEVACKVGFSATSPQARQSFNRY